MNNYKMPGHYWNSPDRTPMLFSFPSEPTSPKKSCASVEVESNENKFKASGGWAWGVIVKEFRTILAGTRLNKRQNVSLGRQEGE